MDPAAWIDCIRQEQIRSNVSPFLKKTDIASSLDMLGEWVEDEVATSGALVVSDKNTDGCRITDRVALSLDGLKSKHRRAEDPHVPSVGTQSIHGLQRGTLEIWRRTAHTIEVVRRCGYSQVPKLRRQAGVSEYSSCHTLQTLVPALHHTILPWSVRARMPYTDLTL
jgi:hypothetical protein